MTKYMVAAEADKIQDFVFRASRLREVSGGSSMLSRFCEQVPKDLLNLAEEDIIVSRGGTFRLTFNSKEDAQVASQTLADLYYLATGCSISIADPVRWEDPNMEFREVYARAGQKLRLAKRNSGAESTAHLPYIAYCDSTGLEFAVRWRAEGDNTGYNSRSTLDKRLEKGKETFIQEFLAALDSTGGADLDVPEVAEDVAGYDPRNYVAYLVADGNGMGAIFESLRAPETLKELSKRLTRVVTQALVEPTNLIMKNYSHENRRLAPLLPLILGGDDIFALLPAPFAISFAQEFCRVFEEKMQEELQKLGIAGFAPTMSAAVVICKASYPFRLAHARGEQLLTAAKRRAKEENSSRSVVNFEIIIGNDWGGKADTQKIRTTLRPYWINSPRTTGTLPAYTTTVQSLLELRLALKNLPQKQRTAIRDLFRRGVIPADDSSVQRTAWRAKVEQRIKRSIQLETVGSSAIEQLFIELGGDVDADYLRTVPKHDAMPQGESVLASGVMDLLDSWEFLYDLQLRSEQYEEVEE